MRADASLEWGDSCGDLVAATDAARLDLFKLDPGSLTPTLFVCNPIAEADTSISSVYADLPTSGGG